MSEQSKGAMAATNSIDICDAQYCRQSEDGAGNERLLAELAAVLGVQTNAVHEKRIEFAGREFVLRCRGCLGYCAGRPRVNIGTQEGKKERATVTSLPSLTQQIDDIIAGSWDCKKSYE